MATNGRLDLHQHQKTPGTTSTRAHRRVCAHANAHAHVHMHACMHTQSPAPPMRYELKLWAGEHVVGVQDSARSSCSSTIPGVVYGGLIDGRFPDA